MVREDGWREVHRLFHVERRSKAEIARQLDLDRKTIRSLLRAPAWRPYVRSERTDTLLAEHAAYLGERAPQVQYSARILFQELPPGPGLSRQLRDRQAPRATPAGGRARRRAGDGAL